MNWIQEICNGYDMELIALLVEDLFGIEVGAITASAVKVYVQRACRDAGPAVSRWSDSDFASIIRDALSERGWFPHGRSDDARTPRMVTVFHMGFASIWETPEQLAALRGEPEATVEPAPARSKISKTLKPIRPVDRVARKVARPPDDIQGEGE